MDFTTYFYFVTALAAVYAVSIRYLQNILMGKELMKDVQDKTKQINALYKDALKDKRKAEEMNRLNAELMPKMNQMLMGQMKAMVVILGVFFAFTWVSGHFDPTVLDDVTINLTAQADGTFSGHYTLSNASPSAQPSFWFALVKAYENGNEIARNETVFYGDRKTDQIIWTRVSGLNMSVRTDRETYAPGDTVTVLADAPKQGISQVTATFDGGTRFYVDLPFTIPLLNLRRIYDSQSWFIFSAVIIGLFVNPAFSYVEKLLKARADRGGSEGKPVTQ